MSVHVISWVLEHSNEEGSCRLVLLVLADHADKDGTNAYPAVPTIQHEARLKARSTVQRALRTLESHGSIKAVGLGEKGQTNWTIVMVPQSEAGRNDDASGAASTSSGGVQDAARTVLKSKPSIEPSVRRREIEEVWDHYRQAVKRPKAKLDDSAGKNAKVIDNALELVGLARVKLAVSGLSVSPHHNGENDAKTKYLEIRYALSGIGKQTDEGRIDQMCSLAEDRGVAPAAGSGPRIDPARIERRLEAIRAWRSSGGTHEPERAEEAVREVEAWGYILEFVEGAPWARLERPCGLRQGLGPEPAGINAEAEDTAGADDSISLPPSPAPAPSEPMISRETPIAEKPDLI